MGSVVQVNQYNPSRSVLDEAVATLAFNGVLVMPTDSVYGIGCAATPQNPAHERIFAIKHRDRAQTLPWLVADASDLGTYGHEVPDYDLEMYRHKKMKSTPELAGDVLTQVIPVLEKAERFTNDDLFALLKAFAAERGLKNGQVMWPIRTAVSGKESTPGGATQLLEILGKDESLKRIRAAAERLAGKSE